MFKGCVVEEFIENVNFLVKSIYIIYRNLVFINFDYLDDY